MKFINICACFFVAWDCADKAAGNLPQHLFTPEHAWVWWITAFLWATAALRNWLTVE